MTQVLTEQFTPEHAQVIQEAVQEIAKGIALGAVPILGQALDLVDSLACAVDLYNTKDHPADSLIREAAEFDMILAVVGWIPGPGDGVKRTFRLVNRDPDRFAPVFFDLLRFVLQECGIKTSPEALLEQVLDVKGLQSYADQLVSSVKESSGMKSLPPMVQAGVGMALTTTVNSLPKLVGLMERRVLHWKKKQPNSSAREMAQKKVATDPQQAPGTRDANVSKEGRNKPEKAHANGGSSGVLATQDSMGMINAALGVSGEHIADYHCAQQLGWGKAWVGHDEGAKGKWTAGTPSRTVVGKLSKGGSPKSANVLYRLLDGPNGTGIDAVWRADSHNGGKPYAIVEAKASVDEDGPKFLRKPDNTRKPSITSTLGVNAIADPSELLEPREADDKDTSDRVQRRGKGKKNGAGKSSSNGTSSRKKGKDRADSKAETDPTDVIVQMSHEWIDKNIDRAVALLIAADILKKNPSGQKNYSRHLFFTPLYHPSGSPKAHMVAKQGNLPPAEHTHHDGFHYQEHEVKNAVNKRKASLRKKHGNLPSLKAEQ